MFLTRLLAAFSLSLLLAPSALALRASDVTGKPADDDRTPKIVTRTVKKNVIGTDLAVRRNNQRKKDLTTIANAVYFYRRDHNFKLPKIIKSRTTEICRLDVDPKDCKGLVDLRDLVSEYIDALPVDPAVDPSHPGTGYTIKKNYKDQAFYEAPLAEEGWSIRLQK